MHTPFVSVVVPVLNDETGLGLCLRALEDQSYPPDAYEVVVVDNGSERPLFDHAPPPPHVVAVVERQPGSYAARNAGIRRARGEVIALTDADCIPDRHWLRSGVEHLTRLPADTVLAGKIDRSVPDEGLTAAGVYDHVFFLRQELYVKRFGFAVTANLVVPADVFRRVGLFDDTRLSGGDVEWTQRATQSGINIRYARNVRVWHPTIATVPALIRRVRRIVGGRVHDEVRSGMGTPARLRGIAWELSDTLPRWRTIRAAARSRSTSIGVCALIVLIQLARAAERARLLCGGKPRRQ